MKIRMLTSLCGPDYQHPSGAVVEFSAAEAKSLIEAGYAEPVGEKPSKRAQTRSKPEGK